MTFGSVCELVLDASRANLFDGAMPNEETQLEGGARRRKEARPAEILEAALAEFAKNGYAGARLEDVAERAGIAKGTIYLYFKNKHELFEGVVRHWIVPEIAHVEALVETFEGSTAQLLESIVNRLYDRMVMTDRRLVMKLIIGEGTRFPELTSFYYKAVVGRGRLALQAALKRGVARGEIEDGPYSVAPEVLIAPTMMAAIWKTCFEDQEPLDLALHRRAHLSLILRGLGLEPSEEGASTG